MVMKEINIYFNNISKFAPDNSKKKSYLIVLKYVYAYCSTFIRIKCIQTILLEREMVGNTPVKSSLGV